MLLGVALKLLISGFDRVEEVVVFLEGGDAGRSIKIGGEDGSMEVCDKS